MLLANSMSALYLDRKEFLSSNRSVSLRANQTKSFRGSVESRTSVSAGRVNRRFAVDQSPTLAAMKSTPLPIRLVYYFFSSVSPALESVELVRSGPWPGRNSLNNINRFRKHPSSYSRLTVSNGAAFINLISLLIKSRYRKLTSTSLLFPDCLRIVGHPDRTPLAVDRSALVRKGRSIYTPSALAQNIAHVDAGYACVWINVLNQSAHWPFWVIPEA